MVGSNNPNKHTMLKQSTVQLMALGLVGSFAATAAAQDSGALIDALVRKGVLKDQEAEQIRSQLSKDFAATAPAGKLNLSSSIKELKLSGDVRLRFQYDNKDAQPTTTAGAADTSSGTQRDRWRLRLRVGADYKLSDNFFAGFGLQTEQKSDSGNQTMAGGNGSSVTGTSAAGDYGQNYSVFINKAFIGWTPVPGVTLVGGKQVNPMYTTDLVWDADINPTGFSERVDLHKFLNLGPLELSLVGLQFIVSDGNESLTSGKTNRDGWIYHTQLVAGLNVAEGVKLTVAPGFYNSNAAQMVGDGGNEAGFGAGTSTGLQGLKIITAPGDVSFKIAGKPVKFQWDLAYNKDGSDRNALYTVKSATTATAPVSSVYTVFDTATSTFSSVSDANNHARAVGSAGPAGGTTFVVAQTTKGNASSGTTAAAVSPTHAGTDDLAYLVGFQIGENKKKGDWSLLANYRQVGLSAVDPNVNDSDWSLSYTNMAGFKVGFFYNLGDATTIGTSFYSANNLRKDLGLGYALTNSGPGSISNSVQVLQVDLSVKF